MPILLDLTCTACGAEHPRTMLRGRVQDAMCGACQRHTLRASWKRGAAPAASLFRAVTLSDGSEIASEEEIAVRARKVLRRSDPGTRVVMDDDPVAARARIEELRHDTWERRAAMGIDAKLMAAADQEGRARQAERDADAARRNVDPNTLRADYTAPSALDRAKVARYGTTDPAPKMLQEGIAEAHADLTAPSEVAAGYIDEGAPLQG